MAKNLSGDLMVASANRLGDGVVVFLDDAGEWMPQLDRAAVARDKSAGEILLERARAEAFSVVDPYLVAVSEGIHDEKGEAIITKLMGKTEKDAHGNVQLSGTGALADLLCEEVKAKLGISRVRGDTFGYLQRSFVGCVSKVDQREAREVGEKAVQYALQGAGDGSVAIRRVGNYAVDYPLIPLETVAGRTRVMEDHLINAAGNDVTPAFHDYLRPLLGADVIEVARLRAAKVEKAGVLAGDAT